MRLSAKLLLVFVGQVALAWLLYRFRMVSRFEWAESDFVVFVIPLLIGFVLSAAVLLLSAFRKLPTYKRAPVVIGLAGVGSFIASWIGMVIGFNLYRT